METAGTTTRSALAEAATTSLARARSSVAQAQQAWRVILQATVAASLAYAAAQALGHEVPFFAPIAAVATVAVSLAHRTRRAAELLVGNAIGILLADLLVAVIGTGAWQVGLVVALALTGAFMAGGGPILIVQAASAAILIATLIPPTADEPWNTGRFIDALIGGGIGLAVSALLVPVDPGRHAREAAAPILATLSSGYREVGVSLTNADPAAAQAVLTDLRATAPVLDRFRAGLDATRESVRLAPWYWGRRTLLASYAQAGFHLDNALRNLRVLARQATVALDRGERVLPAVPAALALMAQATSALDGVLAGQADPMPVRETLLEAVAQAGGAAPPASGDGVHRDLFSTPMVAQIRLSVADLLQSTGLSASETVTAIRAVADPSS